MVSKQDLSTLLMSLVYYVCSIPLRDMVAKKDLRTLLMSLVYYVCSIPLELSPQRYGSKVGSQDTVDVTGILCLKHSSRSVP